MTPKILAWTRVLGAHGFVEETRDNAFFRHFQHRTVNSLIRLQPQGQIAYDMRSRDRNGNVSQFRTPQKLDEHLRQLECEPKRADVMNRLGGPPMLVSDEIDRTPLKFEDTAADMDSLPHPVASASPAPSIEALSPDFGVDRDIAQISHPASRGGATAMRHRWITPLYGFSPDIAHIGVPATAQQQLQTMASELAGTNDLVAVYIPEGTEDVYAPGNMRGRIVGAVRLLKMPRRKTIADYSYQDWDGALRWPIRWPCTAVLAPPELLCPTLRTLVDLVFRRPGSFAPYVARFLTGPFRLEPQMTDALATYIQRVFS